MFDFSFTCAFAAADMETEKPSILMVFFCTNRCPSRDTFFGFLFIYSSPFMLHAHMTPHTHKYTYICVYEGNIYLTCCINLEVFHMPIILTSSVDMFIVADIVSWTHFLSKWILLKLKPCSISHILLYNIFSKFFKYRNENDTSK